MSTSATYTLPTASASILGGIKVGTGLSISSGVLSATGVATTDASLLTSGTLADARLSANVPLLASLNTFTKNLLINSTSATPSFQLRVRSNSTDVLTVSDGGSVFTLIDSFSGGSVFSFGVAGAGALAGPGTQVFLNVAPTVSQSGTQGYTGIQVNVNENTTGSGSKLLLDLQATNVSKASVDNSGNLTLAGTLAATSLSGTLADARLSANVPLLASSNTFTTAGSSASSGISSLFSITPTLTQSGTAGYTALLVNSTETSTGSGAKLLANFQVGGSSVAKLDNGGNLSLNEVRAISGSGLIFRDSSGNETIRVSGGTNQCAGQFTPLFSSASGVPIICQGVASQTADLQRWQNSAAAIQFAITNRGSGGSPIWALKVRATANAESMAQAHVIGAATGKAIEVMDDAGASLGWIALYA